MAQLSKHYKDRLYKYFSIRVGAYYYKKGWLKGTCPYCGREQKFGMNLSRNFCHCFRCDVRVSPIDVVMKIEGLEKYADVLSLLDNEDYSGSVYKEEKVELQEKKSGFTVPEEFRLLNQGNSTLANLARKYMKNRGFDINYLSKHGWGYCASGKYMGYIIIPFYKNNELVYFNARCFFGNGPRYNNPDTEETGIGKSFILYNWDALKMYRTIYICEGAINAQTIGDNAIASGGKAISRAQINQIIKSPVERVVILFDPDAKHYAINLAFQLVEYKKVKVIFLPEGKDVNDLGRGKNMKMVYKNHYLNHQDLMKLKLQYNV